VEAGQGTLEEIARAVGFKDAGRMRRAFLRCLGQSPQVLRRSMLERH
jgi:Transcriptional regulator containing an amidase domain and an AraC-type DNA-binding HTH domain